jgi:hypothetical protein
MKYQVIIKSKEEAVVQTTYLIKEFSYVFLAINWEAEDSATKKKKILRKYTFTSSALQPPFAKDDVNRFKVIRKDFHGEDDINVVVEATSLQEACDKFATPYNDVFEIISQKELGVMTPRRY